MPQTAAQIERLLAMLGDDGEVPSLSAEVSAQLRAQLRVSKEAVERWQATSGELRRVLDTAATGLTRLDRDLRYLSANPAYATLVGLPVDQIVGKTMAEVLGEASLEVIRPHIERALRGERVEYEAKLPLPSLGDKFIHVVYTPDHDSDGRVVGWVASVTDITERKKVEESLQKSESRFRSLFENAPDAVFLTISDGRTMGANPAACSMFGMTEEEICRAGRSGLVDPTDTRHVEAFELRDRTGRLVNVELRYRRKNGEVFFGEVSSVVLPGGDGQTFVTIRDITDRRRAEDALRQRDEQVRTLIANLHSGVALIDETGRFAIYNAAFLRMFGLSEQVGNVNDQDWSRWQVFDENSALLSVDDHPIRKAAATSKPVHNRLVRVKRPCDDNDVWMLINAEPVLTPDGQLRSLICTYYDLTEQRKAQQALQQSEERYRSLFDAMTEGFAIHEIITDAEGRPVDYRFLDINPSFERLTGLRRLDVVGRTLHEVLPSDDPQWVQTYGKVALTGEPVQFENYSPALQRHFEVFAFRPAPRQFATIFMDITQRKQVVEALRESETRLRAVLDQAPCGITIREHPSGQMLLRNEEAERILGGTVTDFGQMAEYHAIHADGRPYQRDDYPVVRSAETGETIRGEEFICRRGDGQSLTLNVNAAPIRGTDGGTVAVVCVFNDMTERKRAEEALHASEERLRQALAAGRVMTFEWNPSTDEVVRSETAGETMGLGSVAVRGTGKAFFAMIHPEDRQRLLGLIDGLAEQPEHRYSIEYRILRPDGSVQWVHETAQGAFVEGRLVRLSGMTVDITQRRLAEEKLRESRDHLAYTLEIARAGTVHWDLRTHELHWNTRYFQILGYEPDAFTPTHEAWRVSVHPDDLARAEAEFNAGIREAREHESEYRIVRPNGEVRWIRAARRFERDHEGKVVASTNVVFDVTEMRQAQEQMRQAKEAAEHANRAKDHFLAVLSHELRTPLTPVLTTAQMMEADASLSADQQDMARIIRRNVELEARLIDDLLDLTRIARNKLELHAANVDVHEKVTHVIDMCQEEIAAKQIKLATDFAAIAHHVQADPARFQQIIWNLLKNAIKFTAISGRITIATANGAEGWISVTVVDTGVGIEAEALPLIFEAFEQGGRAITRQFGGLGLGLAISKALVEMHGGTVAAASEGKYKGATFTVVFPTNGMTTASGKKPPIVFSNLACSVLLVEDHADTRRTMARLLMGLGCTVTTAGTVNEASKALEQGQFDLLISDIGLPDGTGLDVMRRARDRHDLKGIAMSGYGMDEDIAKSKAAGFAAHLTKPVNLHVLEETVRRLTATK